MIRYCFMISILLLPACGDNDMYEWDLTKIQTAKELERPDAKWLGPFLSISPDRNVKIRFDREHHFTGRISKITFNRRYVNNIDWVELVFHPQDKTGIKQTAMEIVHHWDAPTDRIQTWNGEIGGVLLEHRDQHWTIALRIAAAISHDKPYALIVDVVSNEAIDELLGNEKKRDRED